MKTLDECEKLEKENSVYRETITKMISLLTSDAYAMSFQSMAKYRKALLDELVASEKEV